MDCFAHKFMIEDNDNWNKYLTTSGKDCCAHYSVNEDIDNKNKSSTTSENTTSMKATLGLFPVAFLLDNNQLVYDYMTTMCNNLKCDKKIQPPIDVTQAFINHGI